MEYCHCVCRWIAARPVVVLCCVELLGLAGLCFSVLLCPVATLAWSLSRPRNRFRGVILSYVTVHKRNQEKSVEQSVRELTVRELFLCIMATAATAMTVQDNDNRPTARYSFCCFILVPAPAALPCCGSFLSLFAGGAIRRIETGAASLGPPPLSLSLSLFSSHSSLSFSLSPYLLVS